MRELWIFYTAAGENNFVFFWGGQNGAIYITYTFFTQPAAAEKIRGFDEVKMVPYIHILGGQNGAIYIYTHLEFFFFL